MLRWKRREDAWVKVTNCGVEYRLFRRPEAPRYWRLETWYGGRLLAGATITVDTASPPLALADDLRPKYYTPDEVETAWHWSPSRE